MGQPSFGDGAAEPRRRGGVGKWIGLGCGCLLLLLVGIGLGVYFIGMQVSEISSEIGSSLGLGEEVAGTAMVTDVPYTLSFQQTGAGNHTLWLALDVAYTQGLQLAGPINVTANGQPLASEQLMLTGNGSPIQSGSASFTTNWVSTNINGQGSTRGRTRLFTIPEQPAGTTIEVSGTVTAAPGTQVSSLRISAHR